MGNARRCRHQLQRRNHAESAAALRRRGPRAARRLRERCQPDARSRHVPPTRDGAALGAGASRRALVGQLLAESAVIGLIGCIAGLGVGALCLRLLVKFWSPRFEAFLYGGVESLQLNGMVLVFNIAATVLSVLMVGLAPALQASRPSLGEALMSGERVSGGYRWPPNP